MGVLSVQMGSTGLAGVNPRVVYIDTNDTLATVTTAGYLNGLVQQGCAFSESDMCCVTTRTTPNAVDVQVAWLEVSFVSPNWSLVPTGSPGQVVLPTVASRIVHATNATGTLSTDAANVTNAGNISAGLSGTAGTLTSFPATLNTGSLIIAAVSNGGNFNVTLRNASMGQATVIAIPDPGVATANIILSQSAGTQTIGTGNLTVSNGNIAAGNSTTPTAGNFQSFPAASGGANDKFVLAAVTTGGNFTSTISNGTQGQTTVFTLPDPVSATARILVAATATPFTAGHSVMASGTGGLMVDAGYQMKTVAQAAVAGGAAAQVVVDAFCTAASMVTASWNDTTNAVQIQKVAAGIGQFTVTSTADPGASHLNYIITKTT